MWKEGNYKKHCGTKSIKKDKGCDYAPSKIENAFLSKGRYVYLDSSSTRANHESWLVELGASLHMTPHMEWFCKYEMHDSGDVLQGHDDN